MVSINLLTESVVLLRLPANAEMKIYAIIFVFQTVASNHFQSINETDLWDLHYYLRNVCNLIG